MICAVQLWAPQARESQADGGWVGQGRRGGKGDGREGEREAELGADGAQGMRTW